MSLEKATSRSEIYVVNRTAAISTRIVALINSSLAGQFTFFNSARTSFKNCGIFVILPNICYARIVFTQARGESNAQPLVLETSALAN